MKKQVDRPPEKRQRLGPRKILRSKKDKKTCPGLGRKRGNAAHDERLAAAGAARRAYAPPYPAPAHKTGACIRTHTAKISSGRKRTSGTPLLGRRRRLQRGGAVQSHAGCRVQVVHRQRLSGRFPCVGRFPMANSQNPIHTDTPDGNFYSAAPGMIFDTARKKHSARQHIPPQSAGGDEKRPITLRGNFLTEPLSAR